VTESIIREFTGSGKDSAGRTYYYGVSGVRVLDSRKVTCRLYRFDPGSNIMTENSPAQPGKVLRRFVFDQHGMLEETFSFGQPPRTFRYEDGGRRIVMREGGDYGAVGRTFTFEGAGVAETAYGRDGTIERVYVFEPGGKAITIRTGGWYGDVERRLACDRIDATVFQDAEAFLQFLMFTEKSDREKAAEIEEQAAKIRQGTEVPKKSRYAYTGVRQTSDDAQKPADAGTGRSPVRPGAGARQPPEGRSAGRRPAARDDSGIDFIPDADTVQGGAARQSSANHGRSAEIPFEDRRRVSGDDREELQYGQSAKIPLDERFRSSREEDRTLNKGMSADIPLEERFQKSREERGGPEPGRSVQIPYEERRTGKKQQQDRDSL